MEPTASYALINIVNNTVTNLNLNVVINLFVYFGAATAGALTFSKIASFLLEWLADWLRYKWTARYERRMEEIKDLNTKTHDRLVEITNAIDTNIADKKAKEAKIRLLYSASRLKKYDKTVTADIEKLNDVIIFDHNDIVQVTDKQKAKDLIESIRSKIDKLWFGMS